MHNFTKVRRNCSRLRRRRAGFIKRACPLPLPRTSTQTFALGFSPQGVLVHTTCIRLFRHFAVTRRRQRDWPWYFPWFFWALAYLHTRRRVFRIVYADGAPLLYVMECCFPCAPVCYQHGFWPVRTHTRPSTDCPPSISPAGSLSARLADRPWARPSARPSVRSFNHFHPAAVCPFGPSAPLLMRRRVGERPQRTHVRPPLPACCADTVIWALSSLYF